MNRPIKIHRPEPMDLEGRDYRVGALAPLLLMAAPFWIGLALGWVAHAWIGG